MLLTTLVLHKISLKDTSFPISLNFLGHYLSPEYLLNFLWLVYFTMCGKKIKFMVFTFWKNALIPHSKPQAENVLKIFFLQQQKEVEKTKICFIKIQSENIKMTWNIRFFTFCLICNFSKYDRFTVLKIISII